VPSSRRALLTGGAAGVVGLAVAGAVPSLAQAHPGRPAKPGDHKPFPPLKNDPKGILALPEGFSYTIVTRTGTTKLDKGQGLTPSDHDGMAVFDAGHGRYTIIQNHEIDPGAEHGVPHVKGTVYDPGAVNAGGCTVITTDRAGRNYGEFVGISGTVSNCAGGPTPWESWLTCEETEDKAGTNGYTKDHGFIFEVDGADPRRTGAVPLTAMGRFQHEAIAVDPRTGIIYETEDAFRRPFGLFYRFLPQKPLGGLGSLRAGGDLEAMRVPGVPDLSVIDEPGAVFEGIEWVPVPDSQAVHTPIREQDFGPRGITHAQKLEGCYWGDRSVYFVSSYARSREGSAGDHYGQVWKYEPHRSRLTLVVVFGPSTDIQLPGERPDNICLAPGGGLMVCEDGGGAQFVYGITRRGEVYEMARNRQNTGTDQAPEWGEFAGATFSPDEETMYLNCFEPGTTFAITGPWDD
jgi:uncharacterized protein